jgi:hypothetical protein
MLIKFSVVAGPSIEMYEKEALEMIRAMGLSGTVPSAMSPEDILPAIEQLKSKLNKHSSEGDSTVRNGYNDDVIDAKTRAFPLIELLNNAVKENKSVMWDTV